MSAVRTLTGICAACGFLLAPIQAGAQKEQFVRSKPHVNVGRSDHPDFLWTPRRLSPSAEQGANIRGSRSTTDKDVLIHRWQRSGEKPAATQKRRGPSSSSSNRFGTNPGFGTSRGQASPSVRFGSPRFRDVR
jgi:hypothetical protein